MFEVAHAAGMRTAWSDKHAAYELVAGPDGTGVDDLFTPEINSSTTDPSLPGGAGPDWTSDNTKTQFYDAIKVLSIINESTDSTTPGQAPGSVCPHSSA